MQAQSKKKPGREELLARCLAAFVEAGTIELSLDQISLGVGVSKRMLVHYFGGRENLEEGAMTLLEDRLRAQFSPDSFPANVSPKMVLAEMWRRTTAPESRGVLLLVMDLSRRAWIGSARAKAFYLEQQRLWTQLLMKFLNDRRLVEEILQLFQGAVLAYLITGDSEPSRLALAHLLQDERRHKARKKISRRHG